MKTQTESQVNLNDFAFLPRGQETENLVLTPTLVTGKLATAVFPRYEEARKEFGDNPHFKFGLGGGSTVLDVNLINQVVGDLGLRTATPADLSDEWLMNAVKNKHYVDSNALVLRSVSDSVNSRNNALTKSLAEHVDLGKGPALVSGFRFKPADDYETGYRVSVEPTEDFAVFHDDRLGSKWNGYRFNEVDEAGLPSDLDQKSGSRFWYTREDGLSGLVLDRNLDLDSNWDHLDSSGSNGRVALFGGEAARENYAAKLRTSVGDAKSELSGRYERADAVVEEAKQRAYEILEGKE